MVTPHNGKSKNTSNAVHLTDQKSVIMATYMLCGFANFASIGIQIGGIGSLAPGQRKTLSEFGLIDFLITSQTG